MGLGAKVSQVVKEVTYEVTDPTVDSQVIDLKGSGADTLFTMATPSVTSAIVLSESRRLRRRWQPAVTWW